MPIVTLPEIDTTSPLQFVVNAASGSSDVQAKREVVEAALRNSGRRGDLLFCDPVELPGVAQRAALKALASRTAVVAVGGDGTLNAVAQAAHATGCAMGVVPQGTFNYFARTHGIPIDPAEAVRLVLTAQPKPVQVAGINDRIFLVNASLGLYPELLEDRETYKARFGRRRWVAALAGCFTLLRAQRRMDVHIEMGGEVRDVQTLTIFVGNNRMQLQQLGAEPEDTIEGTPGDGSMAALMLKPMGSLAMVGLMLRGALGRLGEAAGVEHFEFQHMIVKPKLAHGRHGVKVAFDGEVSVLRPPLSFRVLDWPLYLLAPHRPECAE